MNSPCTTSKYTLLLTTPVTWSPPLFLLEQCWVKAKTHLGLSFWTCRPAFPLIYSSCRKNYNAIDYIKRVFFFLTFSSIWMKQYSFHLIWSFPKLLFQTFTFSQGGLLSQVVNSIHYSLILISFTVRELPFQVLTVPSWVVPGAKPGTHFSANR